MGSHKAQVRGHGIRAREEEEPPTIKKMIFYWRSTKEGRNFLGRRTTRGKNKKWKGINEVEGVGSPQGVTRRLEGVKAHEKGAQVSHNIIHQGKTSIPLGGHNV